MGLDIMFHVIKHPRKKRADEKDDNEYLWSIKEAQDKKFAKECKEAIEKWFKEAETFPQDNIRFYINQFRLNMKKYFPYDFQTDKLKEAEVLSEVANWYLKIDWDWFYKPEAAYFRKVNCIYRYFQPRLKDEMCRVTKDDIKDIIERATKVLLAHDEETSHELLPTQEGFFFGSTDYDNWYYHDMVEILRECGKLLLDWEDDDICFVYMSW